MIISAGPRRAAILDDESTATFDAVQTLRASAPGVPNETPLRAARCAVEVLRQGGGLMPRALLGGHYTPDGADEVMIHVAVSGTAVDGTATCPSALARPLVPGLPVEFAGPVVAGLLRSALPPGTVVVDRGAFDPVESSPMAFERAADLLAVVLGAMSAGLDVDSAARAALEASS